MNRRMMLIFCISVCVTGCETPDAILRADEASIASITAYRDNTDIAINSLLVAFRESSFSELDLLIELALVEERETIGGGVDPAAVIEADRALATALAVPDLTPGQMSEAAVEFRTSMAAARLPTEGIIRPDVALEAVRSALLRARKIDAEVDRFREVWASAGSDLIDALRLRSEMRRYLEAGGAQPGQIATLAEALARQIEGGQDGR